MTRRCGPGPCRCDEREQDDPEVRVVEEPMADDLEAALDSIEHPADLFDKTWLLTVYVPAATTLAAAVRAERIENAHLRQAFVTMERAYNEAVAKR
jgi:hypothetical protein